MPVSSGRWLSSSVNASSPPAEAPMQTTRGSVPASPATTAAGRATVPGRRLPISFATRHHYLSRRAKRSTCRATVVFATSRRVDKPHNATVCPTSACPAEQILDSLADLHELIQAGRLGNEPGNSQVLEHRLVRFQLRPAGK